MARPFPELRGEGTLQPLLMRRGKMIRGVAFTFPPPSSPLGTSYSLRTLDPAKSETTFSSHLTSDRLATSRLRCSRRLGLWCLSRPQGLSSFKDGAAESSRLTQNCSNHLQSCCFPIFLSAYPGTFSHCCSSLNNNSH